MKRVFQKVQLPKLKYKEPSDVPSISEVLSEAMAKISKKQNDHLEFIVREFAIPPVKGEITKGKLKWRGLKLCHYNEMFESYTWIEQRGKQIGPKLHLKGFIT